LSSPAGAELLIVKEKIRVRERLALLREIEAWVQTPMLILGLVWLGLLVVELTVGLNPLLARIVIVIWALFVLEFALRFLVAPKKLPFLRRNWLTAIALLVPALRALRVFAVFRALRLATATRGLRLVKMIGALNRGRRVLRRLMKRRRLGYVLALTVVVLLLGSAGIYSLEGVSEGGGIESYGQAVWFTAMVLTTLGSEAWPISPEGRLLTFLLALYAFAIFGYVTAALASFFVGRDAENEVGEVAGSEQVELLRREIEALRVDIRRLADSREGHVNSCVGEFGCRGRDSRT
jgi:voltage-gated potassium channel